MLTDFERELSELLQTLTPEPPDHLAAPRVATLPEASPVDDETTVIELVSGTQQAPSRRNRWTALLAAAAVGALAAGVVALTQLGNSDHKAPGPVGTAPPTNVGLPQCRNSQTVISQGPHMFATHGSAGTVQATYRNTGAKACTVTLTSVTTGTETTGGTPFPGSAQTIRIPGHRQVVLTAHLGVAGQCEPLRHGLRINLIQDDGWTYSFWLNVTGCTLTPQRVTHHVAG